MSREQELGHQGLVRLVIESDFILKPNTDFKADGMVLTLVF